MTVAHHSGSALVGRLQKRQRHLGRWAEREGITAYRLFDRDVPGYHFAVDRYGDQAVVAEYPWKAGDPLHHARREELEAALLSVCGLAAKDVVWKTHVRNWKTHARGGGAAGPGGGDRSVRVREGPLKLEVNLGPYLDVGLFLDHRTTRRWVRERAKGKRVLNLFAYTGSFTVAAAVGGARETVSVDLSRTYLDWARRNLVLNGVQPGVQSKAHALVAADVLAFVEGTPSAFDLIVCDPPPASVSARAKRFEIQADHERLLLGLRPWLAPQGAILFSANLGGFELSPRAAEGLPVRELTPGSLPEDFKGRPKPPHRAWLIGDPWLVR